MPIKKEAYAHSDDWPGSVPYASPTQAPPAKWSPSVAQGSRLTYDWEDPRSQVSQRDFSDVARPMGRGSTPTRRTNRCRAPARNVTHLTRERFPWKRLYRLSHSRPAAQFCVARTHASIFFSCARTNEFFPSLTQIIVYVFADRPAHYNERRQHSDHCCRSRRRRCRRTDDVDDDGKRNDYRPRCCSLRILRLSLP